MELKIDEKKNNISVEIIDGDETFANLLISKLQKMKGVEFAAYLRDHPLSNKITVQVKGDNPKKSIVAAVESIKEDVASVRKHLPATTKKEIKVKKTVKKVDTAKKAVKKTKTKSKKKEWKK